MTVARVLLALSCLALCTAPVAAADLTKIDRTIAKEPAYQSKAQKYCLLVLGAEAKTRIWFVWDGDVVYMDRNGNGDLTEEGERAELVKYPHSTKLGRITARDDKAKPNHVWVRHFSADSLVISAAIEGKGWDALAYFAGRPQDAPIIHFDGPLTLSPRTPRPLARGEKGTIIAAFLGTPGLGKDSFASVHAKDATPEKVTLVADIEFPNKQAGGKPIRVKLGIPFDG